jgi:3' terminal RNA ribose 2'-O-methyltransferase Hen1
VLLTISTTHEPATDLGFLLHKHPDRVRTVALPFGPAHVFFPQADAQRCTVAVMLEIDPVGLVRDRRGSSGERFSLAQYVNDRPYVASSFLSVAIPKLFGTAMSGRSDERPELAQTAIPLEVAIAVLPCRGGDAVLRRLFEPLGYEVDAAALPLDAHYPEWGDSRYYAVTLRGRLRVADVLAHLYVLLPVLDDEKHYWVGAEEVDKLLRRGGNWLAAHPDRELIANRFLRHDRSLTRTALARLLEDDTEDPDDIAAAHDEEEAVVEERVSLNDQRIGAVVAALRACGAHRIVDLGCGEGKLLRALLGDSQFSKVVGVDASWAVLQRAHRRLRVDRMPPRQRERLELLQSSLTYRDRRIAGFDAAAVVEVIEHLDPGRLDAFELALFGAARPDAVVVTTPNVEYNVRFDGLPAGRLRHRDHRFEWTRREFEQWASGVAQRNGYEVRYTPIGPVDDEVGAPTQMAVFSR